jgi:hypothetical protein
MSQNSHDVTNSNSLKLCLQKLHFSLGNDSVNNGFSHPSLHKTLGNK